jgi:hypothetical protein
MLSILNRLIVFKVRTLRYASGAGRRPRHPHEESLRAGTATPALSGCPRTQGRWAGVALHPWTPNLLMPTGSGKTVQSPRTRAWSSPRCAAPHPCIDWRGDIVVTPWRCMAMHCAVREPWLRESGRCHAVNLDQTNRIQSANAALDGSMKYEDQCFHGGAMRQSPSLACGRGARPESLLAGTARQGRGRAGAWRHTAPVHEPELQDSWRCNLNPVHPV